MYVVDSVFTNFRRLWVFPVHFIIIIIIIIGRYKIVDL